MKIAMIGQKRIPSRLGGVEVVVQRLSEEMVKLGFDVTAFNRNDSSNKKLKNFHGIKIITVPTIRFKGLSAVTSSFFATIFALLSNYDVIHFHAEGPAAMCWLPKLCGKKTIVTIHGLDFKRDKWGKFARQYIKFGERIAVKYADQIIVLNKELQNYFWETYHRKTILIPNGIDKPINQKIDIIKKFGLSKDSYFLFLGRIVPEKGIEELIKAFKKVKTKKKLIIAGGSSDTDDFTAKMIRLASSDSRIKFIGYVKSKTLQELYSNAYVYVLPSKLEGMPMGLLEAKSYGNCCLVSDIPENMSIIKHDGLSFKKEDTRDLQHMIQLLVNKPILVQKCKKKAQESFSSMSNWKTVAEQTIKVYEGKE